jgi:hypothetical protein
VRDEDDDDSRKKNRRHLSVLSLCEKKSVDAFRTQQTLRKNTNYFTSVPGSRLLSLPQSDPRQEKLDNQHVVGLFLSLSLSLSPLSVAKYGKKVLPTTRKAAVLAASGSGSNTSAGSGFVVVVVASGRARHSGCMKTNGWDEWKSSQWHPMDGSPSTL